jgi:ABC-type lipoprotein export system ATPase subunit
MQLIEMSDYTLAPSGSGQGIYGFYLSVNQGDVCAVEAGAADDAHRFLRALATLVRPLKGTYRFKGSVVDLRNHKDSLRCKRQIGYIAPDAALISNLTLRQNLLLNKFYFENDLALPMDERACSLCEAFDLNDKLDKRPAALNLMESQAAIVIRELCKQPEILILNRPEDFLGHARFDQLAQLFNQWVDRRLPVVLWTHDRRLIRRYANRKILIANGSLTTLETRRNNGDKE